MFSYQRRIGFLASFYWPSDDVEDIISDASRAIHLGIRYCLQVKALHVVHFIAGPIADKQLILVLILGRGADCTRLAIKAEGNFESMTTTIVEQRNLARSTAHINIGEDRTITIEAARGNLFRVVVESNKTVQAG